MLIATFGPTTAWVGKTIDFDNDTFILEDHGPISVSDVMQYGRTGHLTWAHEGMSAWVAARAQAEAASLTAGRQQPMKPRSFGARNAIAGLLGAILVTLALQVITPPNLQLTSKVDPSSLTGHLVWNTPFEIGVIAVGFLVGMALGSLGR